MSTLPEIYKTIELSLSLPESIRIIGKIFSTSDHISHKATLNLYISSDDPIFHQILPWITYNQKNNLFNVIWSRTAILSATSRGQRTAIHFQKLLYKPIHETGMTTMMRDLAHSIGTAPLK